ncbi:MAG: LytTR family DNA-binding domain-containing protein [Sporocytophaga sp.]|nr:LytTR family DNA-binding domain-containing protein [Sporocytophaga sp.]
MKVLIIEDERRAASHLSRMINMYDPSIKVCERFDTVKNVIEWLNTNDSPDLIFMDIRLADGMCFSIFNEIHVSAPIIFTTAYDEFALKAFKVKAIDYLLKPINYKDFKIAMDKFRNWTATPSSDKILTQTLTSNYRSKFTFKVGDKLIPVLADEIHCCKSIEKTTYILSKNNKRIICDYTLGQLEQMLDPEKFIRVNRQYLIQKTGIQTIKYHINSRLQVFLENLDSEEIIVSRERVGDFKRWMNK